MSTKKLNIGDTEYMTLLTELNLFVVSGKFIKNLKVLLNALLYIKPISVKSERVFSTTGLFVTTPQRQFN